MCVLGATKKVKRTFRTVRTAVQEVQHVRKQAARRDVGSGLLARQRGVDVDVVVGIDVGFDPSTRHCRDGEMLRDFG